jgi:DNA-binding response OmpR family regulator
MRVLLIDDEPFYFKLIQKKLQESDYELEYVKSGSEGLAKIPSFDPGLLIVDLKLPEVQVIGLPSLPRDGCPKL